MKHAKHKDLHTAYAYYYATDAAFSPSSSGDDPTKKRLNEIIKDAMIVAKNAGFDVFNALSLMDNNLFLGDQLFGQGIGYLVSSTISICVLSYVVNLIDIGLNYMLFPRIILPEL